ncbi:ATPase synthesis protein 25 [Penicillium longicatenatum]|uniref:ATPase synthesis protein 25 n=1 Tax=Penicillium longicatenatum TaxID=1561947 RepID=UPI0025493D28|nr:ATPase synthesis protein 25 [Penicillium longicatenatum]KAJ5650334.1 ATPase synthesis protein 25 [Penicillium longicatenatum]
MSRALLRGAVCQSCRHETLRSFIAVSGLPMPRYTSHLHSSLNARAFSAVAPKRSDRPPISNPSDINFSPLESNSETAPESAAENENNEPAETQVPWYLQEESPTRKVRPIIGDHIPKLPDNSPAMLPNLMEYTYQEIGLDELKLYDLRGLDIPAALGANVIMIIGTARSVKHLNVAADRLCRWLRSTYKLSPYADGLLGRNELKIKLRRKAKRARAASHAGTMIDEKDDGITTGWICVNMGVVDKDVASPQLSEVGFEGFGQLDTGTSVVVQIFTEEKRADVDLDGLWQGTLDRAERKRLQDASEPAPKTAPSINSRGSMSIPGGQRRGIHTERQGKVSASQAEALEDSSSSRKSPGFGMSTESLMQKLVGLPYDNARSELGTGPEDYNSTLFLQLLYASLPAGISAAEKAVLRLRLHSIAVSRQHSGYSKDALFSTFNKFLADGYQLSDELGFNVVAALLTPRLEPSSQTPAQFLPEADVELALQVLERLSLRGVPILNMKVFNMLYDVVNTPAAPCVSPEEAERAAGDKRQMLIRLSKIAAEAEVPFDAVEARKLMFTQFRCQDYDGFWRLWRLFPLKNATRTQADYAQLFQLHAELGEEQRARDLLSAWVPMMRREMTPIILQGPIVNAIMHCILVADPEIQHRAEDGSTSYFMDLWAQCQRALAQAEEMMEEH